MDENTLQTNLNTLKEMVLDEDKLVTYVSLSKELCIHVNESKSLLGRFIDNIKKQPEIELNISYIISGLADDNKAMTTVCSEADLHTVKGTLKIVFYQHAYSVGKGRVPVDNVSFMAVNKFEDFPLCTGLIKSNECVKRTIAEIGNLKSNSQELATVETNPVAQKKIKEENRDNKKVANVEISAKIKVENKDASKVVNSDSINVVKLHEVKSEPSLKSETTSQKNNQRNHNKSQKGIAGFFTKSNSVPAKKQKTDTENRATITVTNIAKNEAVKVKEEKMAVDDLETVAEAILKEPEHKKVKSLNNIKKTAKVEKKRKRVLHVSDSESDDEEKNDPFDDETPANNEIANLESDDEIPPTPSVNTVKITSGIVNPKKKRKIVDKTYTDEDGYILTKKEEVYESCSDNEPETDSKENIKNVNKIPMEISNNKKEVSPNNKKEVSPNNKKNGVKNAKKKISSPQKGKQATLMNFFKKI